MRTHLPSNWFPSLLHIDFWLVRPRVAQFSTSTFRLSCQLSKLTFLYPSCDRVSFSFLYQWWHLFLPLIAHFSTSICQVSCQVSKLASLYLQCHVVDISFLCSIWHLAILFPLYCALLVTPRLVVLIININSNSNINNIIYIIIIIAIVIVDDDDDGHY